MNCCLFEQVKLANGSAFLMHKGAVKAKEDLSETDVFVEAEALNCDEGFAPYLIDGVLYCLQDVRTLTVEGYRSIMSQKVSADHTQAVFELGSDYTQEERNTWSRQVEEATAFQNTRASSLIERLAEARREKPEVVAAKILEKAKAFEEQKLHLFIEHTRNTTEIQRATSIADLPVLDEDVAKFLLPLGNFRL